MMDVIDFFNEYGYKRDMEASNRSIGDGKPNSTATHTANQIKHLKESLNDLVSIVEIHSASTKSNFAWAEVEEARKALSIVDDA